MKKENIKSFIGKKDFGKKDEKYGKIDVKKE